MWGWLPTECSRYVRAESAPSSLAGACSPAAEPRAGPGSLCLPVLGRRQAHILPARPAYLLRFRRWLQRLPEGKCRLLRHIGTELVRHWRAGGVAEEEVLSLWLCHADVFSWCVGCGNMWESKGEQCLFLYILCSLGLANHSLVTFSGSPASL